MPTRFLLASFFVAFIVLSALADRPAPRRALTGTIVAFEADQGMSFAIYPTDFKGFEIALRKRTVYEGNPAFLKPGAQVTVWYRSIGERQLVADKVRLLATP